MIGRLHSYVFGPCIKRFINRHQTKLFGIKQCHLITSIELRWAMKHFGIFSPTLFLDQGRTKRDTT